jgi:hypothetical protein
MASQTIGTLVEAEIQSMIDSCARAMRAKDAPRTLSPNNVTSQRPPPRK